MKNANIFISYICMFFVIFFCQEAIAEKLVLSVGDKSDNRMVYLSDLNPSLSVGSYLLNKNPEGDPVSLKGMVYMKGLVVSSTSTLTYNLNGEYNYFKCVIGHHDAYRRYEGILQFIVLVDGKEVYKSKNINASDSEEVNVSVKGVKRLTLEVKDNGINSLFAVWADAKLSK